MDFEVGVNVEEGRRGEPEKRGVGRPKTGDKNREARRLSAIRMQEKREKKAREKEEAKRKKASGEVLYAGIWMKKEEMKKMRAQQGIKGKGDGWKGKDFGSQGAGFGAKSPPEARARGLSITNKNKAAKSMERREKEGKPLGFKLDNQRWECKGEGCQLSCTIGVTLLSFVSVPELVMVKWLVAHKMMTVECNNKPSPSSPECPGQCVAGACSRDPDRVSLFCLVCKLESKVRTKTYVDIKINV